MSITILSAILFFSLSFLGLALDEGIADRMIGKIIKQPGSMAVDKTKVIKWRKRIQGVLYILSMALFWVMVFSGLPNL